VSAADNPPSPQKQAPPLNLQRFTRILGRLGSEHAGERQNALAAGTRMLEAAGLRWEDIIADAHHQRDIAVQAAEALFAENTELRAELDQLRSAGTAVAVWENVGAAVSDTRRAATWALDLHRAGRVWLSNYEIGFLTRCTRWTGRLTPKMQPVFQRTVDRIVERTGLTPPP
jgi:hypothetical protein